MKPFLKAAVLVAVGVVWGAGAGACWCYKNQALLALLYNLRRER